MTLTLRSASTSIATTKGAALTHAEMDANWLHVAQFTQSGSGASTRTVQNRLRDTVSVKDFGAVGDGSTDDSAAIQAAIDTGALGIFFPAATYKANNLTQSADFQCFYSDGLAQITKNANGDLFTSSGDYVTCIGLQWRGDASSPTFTGNNAVFTGDHPSFYNCGSLWANARALKATGQHVQIYGSNNIWQTATAAGYDIELGVSGTATLYHELHGIYSSQSGGGILLTDTGSHHISGGQFGKLTIAAGTSPSGVGGGSTSGARILGNVSVGVSNSTFTGNQFGAVTITFETGTAGHSFDESNLLDASATLTNDANTSVVVDRRQIPYQSYTPAWTGSVSDPDIGDGTITGRYSKRGREVRAVIQIVMGSTTTFGSGTWFVSLPFIPDTTMPQIGSARFFDTGTNSKLGIVRALSDGTARCQFFSDAGATAITSAIPFTWANGDILEATVTYST